MCNTNSVYIYTGGVSYKMISLDKIIKLPDGSLTRKEVQELVIEIERLRATLIEIWEYSRSLTGYCQWCDARPEINHQLDCPAELALDAIFATTQEDVERLGLSSEQTVILREHLTKRQQTVSEFLGDILMEYGLGRAMGKEYPPPSIQFPQHGYARSTNELE